MTPDAVNFTQSFCGNSFAPRSQRLLVKELLDVVTIGQGEVAPNYRTTGLDREIRSEC